MASWESAAISVMSETVWNGYECALITYEKVKKNINISMNIEIFRLTNII